MQYIIDSYGKPEGQHLMGIFYGGHGQLLLCQFIAVLVIAAWSCECNQRIYPVLLASRRNTHEALFAALFRSVRNDKCPEVLEGAVRAA